MFLPLGLLIVSLVVLIEAGRWMYWNNYNTNMENYENKMTKSFITILVSLLSTVISALWLADLLMTTPMG